MRNVAMIRNIRTAILAIGVLGLAALAPAQAEGLKSAAFSNFRPADQAAIERFSCVGANGGEPDVVVEYGVVAKEPGGHQSRLKSLKVRGVAASATMLDELNESVGEDTVSSVSAGCAEDDIRVVVQVFRPDSITPEACLADAYHYLYIYYRGETGALGFE